MKLGKKILKLLGPKPLSDFASDIEVSRGAMSNYVHRESMPKADTALKMARALEVPLDWLVDDEADFPAPESAGKRLEDHSSHDLRFELSRRTARLIEEADRLYRELLEVDWLMLATRAYELPLDETEPEVERVMQLIARFNAVNAEIDMNLDAEGCLWHFRDAWAGSAAHAKGGPQQEVTSWRDWSEDVRGWAELTPAFRAVQQLQHLRATHTLPSMRDAAELQRQAALTDLQRMVVAQPAPNLKAASVKKKR